MPTISAPAEAALAFAPRTSTIGFAANAAPATAAFVANVTFAPSNALPRTAPLIAPALAPMIAPRGAPIAAPTPAGTAIATAPAASLTALAPR